MFDYFHFRSRFISPYYKTKIFLVICDVVQNESLFRRQIGDLDLVLWREELHLNHLSLADIVIMIFFVFIRIFVIHNPSTRIDDMHPLIISRPLEIRFHHLRFACNTKINLRSPILTLEFESYLFIQVLAQGRGDQWEYALVIILVDHFNFIPWVFNDH